MSKEITKEELKQSLRHYWRMRKWAKKQDGRTKINQLDIEEDIGESWDGEFCILCKTYGVFCASYGVFCDCCPLYLNDHDCNEIKSPWIKLNASKTWGQWIKAATEMARVIMKLPREK
jgi:hypothetical protein